MLDIIMFLAYIGLVLGIGRYWSKRIHSTEDFHLCGRKLGRIPASLSLAATEFSGSGMIGGAGLVYAIGLSGIFWTYSAIPAYVQSSIIITAVFAIYTMMGGLWAVVWTDALQYVVLMVVFATLAVMIPAAVTNKARQ